MVGSIEARALEIKSLAAEGRLKGRSASQRRNRTASKVRDFASRPCQGQSERLADLVHLLDAQVAENGQLQHPVGARAAHAALGAVEEVVPVALDRPARIERLEPIREAFVGADRVEIPAIAIGAAWSGDQARTRRSCPFPSTPLPHHSITPSASPSSPRATRAVA